eukprot:scaffold2607_cov254-Pinguiococcus_pyrenoidosus.AAC.5
MRALTRTHMIPLEWTTLGPIEGCVLVGNGGFSLRNVQWMLKAIRSCPTQFAAADPSGCNASQLLEDQIFAVILRGLGAPLPSAATAWHFAHETPAGAPRDMGEEERKRIPVGVHKIWAYMPPDELERNQRHEKTHSVAQKEHSARWPSCSLLRDAACCTRPGRGLSACLDIDGRNLAGTASFAAHRLCGMQENDTFDRMDRERGRR